MQNHFDFNHTIASVEVNASLVLIDITSDCDMYSDSAGAIIRRCEHTT